VIQVRLGVPNHSSLGPPQGFPTDPQEAWPGFCPRCGEPCVTSSGVRCLNVECPETFLTEDEVDWQ